MNRITAGFKYRLPEPFLYEEVRDEPYNINLSPEEAFHFSIGDFSIELDFAEYSSSSKGILGSDVFAREVLTLEIRITRDESKHIPVIIPDNQGRFDWRPLQEVLHELRDQYLPLAVNVISRANMYFRYVIGHPIRKITPVYTQNGLLNPKWYLNGEIIWDRDDIFALSSGLSSKLFPEYDVNPFNDAKRESFICYLQSENQPSLHEEILADAKVAIAEGHLRRGVLELAIACEVGLKNLIQNSAKFRSSDISWLQDHKLLADKNLDYLDKIPFCLFGKSVRSEHKHCYNMIDRLFHCRNCVVHEGKLKYKDDKGCDKEVDSTVLKKWWESVSFAITNTGYYVEISN